MADESKRETNSEPPVDKTPDAVVPTPPANDATAPVVAKDEKKVDAVDPVTPAPVVAETTAPDADNSKFGGNRAGATQAVVAPELDSSMTPPVVATTTLPDATNNAVVPDAVVLPNPVTPAPEKPKSATPADGTVATAEMPAGEVTATGEKPKPTEKTVTTPENTAGQPEETAEERETRLKATEAEAIKKAATAKPIEVKQQPTMSDAEKAAMEAQNALDASKDMATQKYRAIYEKRGYMGKMSGEWGVADVDDELKKALGETGTIEDNKKYGLDFKLPTGQTIEWHRNMGGSEFIGMTRKTGTFDLNAAHAVVAASKSKGWMTINVHGTPEQKDMMWLEAQRQKIEVLNHQPALNSKYRQMWEAEQDATPGATPGPKQTPAPDAEMKQSTQAPVEMQAPAQVNTAADGDKMDGSKKDMGKFVKADALPNNGQPVEPEMSEKDRQLAFIDRKMEQFKGDDEASVAKRKGLQEMRDAIEGKNPAPVVDADVSADAAKEGVKLPAVKAADAAAPAAKAMETPEGNLSLSSYLDRELKNPKNSAEITQGLQEMKGALDEGRIKEGDVDVAKLKTEAGGMVSREQYTAIADSLEEKNPDTKKFSRPAAAAVAEAAAEGEKPAVAVAEVVVAGGGTKKTVTAGAPKNA